MKDRPAPIKIPIDVPGGEELIEMMKAAGWSIDDQNRVVCGDVKTGPVQLDAIERIMTDLGRYANLEPATEIMDLFSEMLSDAAKRQAEQPATDEVLE